VGTDKTIENWTPINGFDNYEISSHGRVKSTYFGKEKILKTALDSAGYEFVYICKKGVKKFFRIHRLVAIHFIPNHQNKLEVNHLNGIRNDNKISNLEWVTRSENTLYSFRVLKRAHPKAWLGKFGAAHTRSIPIIQKTKSGEIIGRYASLAEASIKSGFNITTISKIINNKVTPRYFIFEKSK